MYPNTINLYLAVLAKSQEEEGSDLYFYNTYVSSNDLGYYRTPMYNIKKLKTHYIK